MKRKQRIFLMVLLLSLSVLFTGCKSSSREAFNTKMKEGEVLLQAEKYGEAVEYFEALYKENSDSITLMEKLEYAITLEASRNALKKAEAYFEEENYQEVLKSLEGVHQEDEKGVLLKEALLEDMKKEFLTKGKTLLEKEAFDEALALLKEYERLRGEDSDILVLHETILEEKNKPEEPKKLIVLNAGHQKVQDKNQEPLGPGSSETKNRVTSGTRGVATGIYEYELNLLMAEKLEKRLLEEGFLVKMVRTSHEVSISNKERAELANAWGADLYISIHANGSENSKKRGILTIYPSQDNPFVSHLSEESQRLSELLHDAMVEKTGANPVGAVPMDHMASLNWSKVPATIIEMGYMSNREEDVLLSEEAYQAKLVEGMVEGIKAYFSLE
ncbi:N-acetylmuramoyl-L-alanine amidase [Proteiniclasticum sp.]|uniref:N-acetylmuramoyl-L-alanine amidase n=1 Tax=Proteiniclasticum sp. TaxID=2053595 RepID=UPI00289D2493|nr:N-acetylmuramoyl-L-alanine amidase [Proteiniclasticum sp.]